MGRLEDAAVPPFELCKQIPVGAFAFTGLVWTEYERGMPKAPFVREREFYDAEMHAAGEDQAGIPAPGVQELMVALGGPGCYVELVLREGWDFEANWYDNQSDDRHPGVAAFASTAAEALLRLWLRVIGVEKVDGWEPPAYMRWETRGWKVK